MSFESYAARIEAAIDKAENGSEILFQVANGDEFTEVSTTSGPVPSVKKWFLDNREKIADPRTNHAILEYSTYAEASAAAATLPDGQRVKSPDSNGFDSYYTVNSGTLVKSPNKEQGVVNIADFAKGRNDLAVLLPIAISMLPSGGVIKIPNNGSGYLFSTRLLINQNDLSFVCDAGVKIDGTAVVGGINDYVLRVGGSYGELINTVENLTTGDRVIKTTLPHNLVAGDWFLIQSQRACLHDDAGPDWRLGEETRGVRSTFFAEPCQVLSVESPTQLTIAAPLIFPSYRIDNTQETYEFSRPRTTIQKINFVKGFKWVGGKWKTRTVTAIQGALLYKPEIEAEFDLGLDVGHAVTLEACYRPKTWGTVAHDPGLVIGANHAAYACLKEYGCWWATWYYTGYYGMQGLDITYKSGTHPSIMPDCYVSAYDAAENSMTFHSGGYGGRVINPRSIRAYSRGIWVRTRGVEVINPYVVGGIQGVNFQGWGGIDGGVRGGNFQGVGAAAYLERTGIGDGPANRAVTVDGITTKDCGYSVYLAGTNELAPTSEASNIIVRNITGIRNTSDIVRIEQYVNDVDVSNILGKDMKGTGRYVLRANGDCVRHNISGIRGVNIGANMLYSLNGISDTVTFPAASYPNALIWLDRDSCSLSGTGSLGSFNATFIKGVGNTYTLNSNDARGAPIVTGSAYPITITVPAGVFLPGARIEIIQTGAGQITLTPGAGVTLNSRNGLKSAGQYAVIVLTHRTANNWFVSGDTTI